MYIYCEYIKGAITYIKRYAFLPLLFKNDS